MSVRSVSLAAKVDIAWVDGVCCAAASLGARDVDGVFETMGVAARALPLWEQHLRRLRSGARALGLRWRPPARLQRAALDLLRSNQHDVLRLALERVGRGGRWVMATRARDGDSEPLRVVLAPQARVASDGDDVKRCRRVALQAQREQARALGAHDALLWRDGRLLESTAYNVFVLVDDRLRTPPADGSILPGIARAVLLRAGLPIEIAPVSLSALARSPFIVLTNAVYGPRLARLASGSVPPPGVLPETEPPKALPAGLELGNEAVGGVSSGAGAEGRWMSVLRRAWEAAIRF